MKNVIIVHIMTFSFDGGGCGVKSVVSVVGVRGVGVREQDFNTNKL